MSENQSFQSNKPEDTLEWGIRLGKSLEAPMIILLLGELGAGKTLLTRGICQGFGLTDPWEVDSPTYTLMNEYSTQPPILHFDLYRIQGEDELESLSFYDLMESDAIKIIEWPDRLQHYQMPQDGLIVRIQKSGLHKRSLSVQPFKREI